MKYYASCKTAFQWTDDNVPHEECSQHIVEADNIIDAELIAGRKATAYQKSQYGDTIKNIASMVEDIYETSDDARI